MGTLGFNNKQRQELSDQIEIVTLKMESLIKDMETRLLLAIKADHESRPCKDTDFKQLVTKPEISITSKKFVTTIAVVTLVVMIFVYKAGSPIKLLQKLVPTAVFAREMPLPESSR